MTKEGQKSYNVIKWVLGIVGILLIIISMFIDNGKTEKTVEWFGFGSVWAAVMMKFLDPALGWRNKGDDK